MYELISNPGLRFELFDLRGTLTYTFARDGKSAKQYVLSETDFENESGDAEKLQPWRSGIDVSAVGICLRLLKNEGLLHMVFEGVDGGSADWSFEGLDIGAGKPMFASASTQTHVSPDKCNTCGRRTATSDSMQSHSVQTSTVTLKDTATQTKVIYTAEVTFTAEAGVQSRIEQTPAKPQSQSISTQTNNPIDPSTSNSSIQGITTTDSGQEPKRKAPSEPHAAAPVHKRAKSKQDSEPWPRRIYLECWREKPISKGDLGKLIIDTEKATVCYESKYGKDHARTTELKQIDLRAPDTAVIFHAIRKGHDGATHVLDLSRRSKDGSASTLISLHCLAPRWKTWYISATSPAKKVYINDPEIVVDALVHCIDRTSGREAVHDPDADHKLATEPVQFQQSPLWGGGLQKHIDAEWVEKELERRRVAKMKAKVYEPGKTGRLQIPY